MVATLVERFNSGKVSAMMSLYAPEAVFIAKDGRTITDHTEIAAQLERDLKLGLPLEAKARHVFVADDIAQIVLDWSIDGTDPDGKHVHLGGSASYVLRRGADGLWRYLIDNNLGTAVRQPAWHMCATAAVGDGATLQPGVDDHRDTALAQLLGTHSWAALNRAASQKRIKALMERSFHRPGDVETAISRKLSAIAHPYHW
jgi:ketosteroid isomerase-like protein